MMLAWWRLTPCFPSKQRNGFHCRAAAAEDQTTEFNVKKKVLIVGSGRAGLGTAHHLCKQEGLDVTVLEGGYEFGPKNKTLSPDDVRIRVIDFDNTDSAWRKYDPITARELLKQFGCSERLYHCVFDPLLQVGLFAPAEQCSAAATLGILYFSVLAHQTVKEKIFEPWMDFLRSQGCKFLEGRKVTDILIDEETGCISEVVFGKESLKADVIVLAVGISSLQEIIENSAVLCTRQEFLKVLNLESIDLLTVKLQLDRKVNIPNASNISSRFEDSTGWTFFDLNTIYGEDEDNSVTSVEANFEKSYVTGLEAANRVVDYLEVGTFAKIIPVEEDEPHIRALRSLNRNLNEIRAQLPLSNYFLQ